MHLSKLLLVKAIVIGGFVLWERSPANGQDFRQLSFARGRQEATSSLGCQLNDETPEVWLAAALAFTKLGESCCIDPLPGLLTRLHDERVDVQVAAVEDIYEDWGANS